MLSVGGLTLYPIHYRAAFASSLIPSPLSHWLPLQEAYPRGETVGLLRSSSRSIRGLGRAYRPVVQHPRQGTKKPRCLTTYLFGSSLTASLACSYSGLPTGCTRE